MAISIAPAAILQGFLVSKKGQYKYWVCDCFELHLSYAESSLQNFAGWALMLIGVGLLSTLGVSTPFSISVPYQVIAAFGLGFEYATTFAVLAPLDASLNSQALAFLLFSRTFSQVRSIFTSFPTIQDSMDDGFFE
jgi:hypothetical protein